MSRRPVGAPIVDRIGQRDWRAASGRTTAELAEYFALAIAREATRFTDGKDLLVLVSPSLGGLSALAAARLLRTQGYTPRIAAEVELLDDGRFCLDDVAHLRAALDHWGGEIATIRDAASARLVVDALCPAHDVHDQRPEPAWVAARRRLLARAGAALAVDNVTSAHVVGAAMTEVERRPSYTATIALGALRDELVTWPAIDLAGHVLLAPAESPIESAWRVRGRPIIERPAGDAHKYTRGMVVVVAGKMPGAARLAARAAAAAGAGYVVLAGPAVAGGAGLDAVVPRGLTTPGDLEHLLRDERIGAVVVGPGLGTDDSAREWLGAALGSKQRLVLDADALTMLTSDELAGRAPETWITPHHGEWVRLTGETTYDGGKFVRVARWAEAGLGIIHKGSDTVVATPENAGVLDRTAPSWLSTAGTGDVLAGILGARLAVRQGAWRCGHEAVWLHSRAAQLAGPAFAADRLIDLLPQAVAECR